MRIISLCLDGRGITRRRLTLLVRFAKSEHSLDTHQPPTPKRDHAGRARQGLVSALELLAPATRERCGRYLQILELLYVIARFSPISGKTMLRIDTNASRYAGQPVVRRGRALACAVGVYSTRASFSPGELAA